jgi:HSP20 family protein
MNLNQWNPVREFDALFARFPRGLLLQRTELVEKRAGWRPAANVSENDKEYTIRADLPEVSKENIDVSVANGVLTISGERPYENTAEGEKEHRRETFHGSFQRSFALPEDVDVESIKADARDGVLVVRLPKQAAKKPESLKIQVQ